MRQGNSETDSELEQQSSCDLRDRDQNLRRRNLDQCNQTNARRNKISQHSLNQKYNRRLQSVPNDITVLVLTLKHRAHINSICTVLHMVIGLLITRLS